MQSNLSRRAIAAGLFATAVPACITTAAAIEAAKRVPSHAAFWARLPLPFTPAEAWRRLPASTQAEIGAGLIGMVLAEYVHGDGMAEADQFLDDGLRSDAFDVASATLSAFYPRLWDLLPELYGPDGDHPRWALDGGLAI